MFKSPDMRVRNYLMVAALLFIVAGTILTVAPVGFGDYSELPVFLIFAIACVIASGIIKGISLQLRFVVAAVALGVAIVGIGIVALLLEIGCAFISETGCLMRLVSVPGLLYIGALVALMKGFSELRKDRRDMA
jgi:hypothetical protein